MFDIAFSEVVIIMLVALVVIGPERLPKVARSIGRAWGQVQRYVHRVKSDIENDMALEDARKMQSHIHQEIDAVGKSLREDGKTLEQHILQARHRMQAVPEIRPDAPPPPDSPA
jgi:sec-independent protein translocase protein TatB